MIHWDNNEILLCLSQKDDVDIYVLNIDIWYEKKVIYDKKSKFFISHITILDWILTKNNYLKIIQ